MFGLMTESVSEDRCECESRTLRWLSELVRYLGNWGSVEPWDFAKKDNRKIYTLDYYRLTQVKTIA